LAKETSLQVVTGHPFVGMTLRHHYHDLLLYILLMKTSEACLLLLVLRDSRSC